MIEISIPIIFRPADRRLRLVWANFGQQPEPLCVCIFVVRSQHIPWPLQRIFQTVSRRAEGAGSVPVGLIQQILRHRRATQSCRRSPVETSRRISVEDHVVPEDGG